MTINPLYAPQNCYAAYQLNWSLSVFGKTRLPAPQTLIEPLREAVSRDSLKILECRDRQPNVAQFFVSSQPQTSPADIVRAIKGRWQYLSRTIEPISFRRNYRITSVGSATGEVLDKYVARQTEKHPMCDANVQGKLKLLQFHDPLVNLTAVRRSSHGEFAYAIQVVIETESGWNETREHVLQAFQNMIIGSCRKHGWLLSRIGLLSNHLHILIGPGVSDSPDQVALILMNNLAFTQGQKPILRFSFYVGGFGAYDRGVIWNQGVQDEQAVASARTSRSESD